MGSAIRDDPTPNDLLAHAIGRMVLVHVSMQFWCERVCALLLAYPDWNVAHPGRVLVPRQMGDVVKAIRRLAALSVLPDAWKDRILAVMVEVEHVNRMRNRYVHDEWVEQFDLIGDPAELAGAEASVGVEQQWYRLRQREAIEEGIYRDWMQDGAAATIDDVQLEVQRAERTLQRLLPLQNAIVWLAWSVTEFGEARDPGGELIAVIEGNLEQSPYP